MSEWLSQPVDLDFVLTLLALAAGYVAGRLAR